MGKFGRGVGSVVVGIGRGIVRVVCPGVCSYSWGFYLRFGNCYNLRCVPCFSGAFPKVFYDRGKLGDGGSTWKRSGWITTFC